ncbi:hypothetical protein L218DRAFT_632900 [Marasmius fiardii PR-910]|nr:hypothetical protein L218DRAFT_632900 [Marasmius fiardii PR-910]
MATEAPSQYLPLFDVENVVIVPNVTLSIMYFVYGLYTLLFGLCIYVLRRGPAFHLQNLYVSVTAILFVVSTCMVAAETAMQIQQTVVLFNSTKTRDFLPFLKFGRHNTLKTVIYAFNFLLPVIANVAADFILIHRCYIVWRYSKRVLVPLVLASFAVNTVFTTGTIMIITGERDTSIVSNKGLVEKGQTVMGVGVLMSAPFHLIFTLLTAGRIWWITRPVQRSKADWSLNQKYKTVVRIILESGMLYALVIIIHLSIANGFPLYQIPLDTFPLTVLAAGVAPTLIIVRARLGMSLVNDIPSCSVISFHTPDSSTSQSAPEVQASDPSEQTEP